MISERLAAMFVNAATALAEGRKDTGFTGNGLKKLDFKTSLDGQPKIFTVIEQNPSKLSVPGKMAREGRKIFQVRDNERQALLGNVDVDDKRFNSYENIPNPVDIEEIEKSLGNSGIKPEEVQITAARTSTPAGNQPEPGNRNAEQNQRPQPQNNQSNSSTQPVDGDWFFKDNKAA